MKLSDVKGERVFDVIADIVDPIATIAADEDAAKLFQRDKVPDGMTTWEFFLQKIRESLPSLLRTHKEELIAILCSIKGESRDEYVSTLTFASLFADLTELVTDAEFTSFFE